MRIASLGGPCEADAQYGNSGEPIPARPMERDLLREAHSLFK